MYSEFNNLREFCGFRLDTEKKILWYQNEAVTLPLKEIELLCVLTESDELVTKDEILNRVWQDSFVEESNLSSHIYRLRKMFAKYGESENLIQTVPKRGYRFTGQIIQADDFTKLIIEKHSISRTIIEEIETSIEPNINTLPPKPSSNRYWIPLLICLIILITAVGYYIYSRNANKIGGIKSIAVLPLKSFDEQAVDESLRLRMMDSLITKLGKIESISIRPTSSTMKFLKSDETSLEIGKKLLVDAILEGSIQREENKIRVTLQLVSVQNGEQLWSDQFDGEADKLLDLQNAVSVKLYSKLNLSISNEQQTEFAKRPTANPEAYEEYLKGRFFWQKRTPESLQSAISAFEKAIKLDPNFADAYVGLADSHYLFFDYSYDTSPKNVELAKKYLTTALELNPTLSEAFTTLGLIQTTYEWNWKAAENSLRKAKELAPNSPNAHHRYGTFLAKLRRFDEAETELRKAKEFDPTSTSINMNLGFILMNSKRFDEAINQLQKTLELDTNFISARWYLVRCYWHKGETKKSLMESAKAIELVGDKDLSQKMMQNINSIDEKKVVQNWIIEWQKQLGPQGINDHDLAILSFYLNDKQETLSWLEKSVAAHHPWATWINAEPEFDFVRNEPRFQALLKKMNFE